MKKKKIIEWTVIFSVLGCFTFYAVAGVFMPVNYKTAYAETIKAGMKSDSGNYVYVGDAEFENGEITAETEKIEKFLELSIKLSKNDVVCEVGKTDAQYIYDNYETKLHALDVEGHQKISFLRVEGNGSEKHEIMTYLNETHPDLDCKIIQKHNWLFLLFNPQLS